MTRLDLPGPGLHIQQTLEIYKKKGIVDGFIFVLDHGFLRMSKMKNRTVLFFEKIKNLGDRMKIFKKILLIIVLSLIGMVLFKDQILKATITTAGSKIMGVPLKIERFSFKISSQKILISGMKVYNPKGFPEEPLIYVEKIIVEYDLKALRGGKIHLPLLVLDLKDMVVVKNKNGRLNVDSLPIIQQQSQQKEAGEEKASQKSRAKLDMQIDILKLNVGKVVYKDFSKGDDSAAKAYDVGLKDKEYKNITSIEQLVTLIMAQALKATAINGAKIYGLSSIASLAGVGFLPAGVATLLVSKDHSLEEFDVSFNEAYQASLAVVKEQGKLEKENFKKGTIKGKIDGYDIAISVKEGGEKKTSVTVSARKLLLPKPKIAAGIIHQIFVKLKKQ